jgi:type II secretory pathway component HofQ
MYICGMEKEKKIKRKELLKENELLSANLEKLKNKVIELKNSEFTEKIDLVTAILETLGYVNYSVEVKTDTSSGLVHNVHTFTFKTYE